MDNPPQPETTADRLNRDIDMARTEIGRADGKAGELAKMGGAGLALLVAVGSSRHLPAVSLVLGALAMASGLAALAMVGLVIWPRLGRTVLGYLAHRGRTDAEIVEASASAPTDEQLAEQARYLARAAAAKFWLIRCALLALVAGALLAVTATLLR